RPDRGWPVVGQLRSPEEHRLRFRLLVTKGAGTCSTAKRARPVPPLTLSLPRRALLPIPISHGGSGVPAGAVQRDLVAAGWAACWMLARQGLPGRLEHAGRPVRRQVRQSASAEPAAHRRAGRAELLGSAREVLGACRRTHLP